MTIEEFSKELSAFVEQLMREKGQQTNCQWKHALDFGTRRMLDEKIKTLAEKHFNGPPQFIVGEDDSSVVSSQELPEETEASAEIVNGPVSCSKNSAPKIPAVTANCLDNSLHNDRIMADLRSGTLKHRELETKLGNPLRSVEIRRKFIEEESRRNLNELPYQNYDFSWVNNACCENIIGYVPIPTGVVGPLRVNGQSLYIPMSTTEGALVGSTNRGCKALSEGKGVTAFVKKDGMSRAPVLSFKSALAANECRKWVEEDENFQKVKACFEATSNFARLESVTPHISGNFLFLRFVATTGDAMGMNMVTKGTTEAVNLILRSFPQATIVTISGNMCVDKKASAINWIEGRGKSVIAEAVIAADVVHRVLKTSVDKMVELANCKLMVGASNSVSIGGSNAHAANVVAAIFLATGQDAAQVVSSSMCLTHLSKTDEGDLNISCTMNCLEVGTVGGGTILSPQQTCLRMLGCCGPSNTNPGENAKRFAEVVCSTVLAGELSLLSAQCTGDLVRSHLRLNRSSRDLCAARSLAFTPENSQIDLWENRRTAPNGQKTRSSSALSASKGLIKKAANLCDHSFT